eukprot:TRINITY_DN6361_c0_g1_i1.p3 TRINITY_DN6361_c0_g1~~TRINITY_DN6361_c0_g1_i1.p3  ORF type:complete len:122 (-),score=13.35 TRINITY_DN6361_c0_g1_i1:174-539(-)
MGFFVSPSPSAMHSVGCQRDALNSGPLFMPLQDQSTQQRDTLAATTTTNYIEKRKIGGGRDPTPVAGVKRRDGQKMKPRTGEAAESRERGQEGRMQGKRTKEGVGRDRGEVSADKKDGRRH